MKISPHYVLAVLGVFTAITGSVTYGFATFETKDHTKEVREELDKHLDRLESKIDKLLERDNGFE